MAPSKPPRCPACALLRTAEGIVHDAQTTEPGWAQVLSALARMAPLPLTALQVACLVEEGSYQHVRTILQALALLGTIERPWRGYYRYQSR